MARIWGVEWDNKKDVSLSCSLHPFIPLQIPDVCRPISMKDTVLSQVKDLCAKCCVGRLPSALALLKPALVSHVMLSLQCQSAMEWKLK